MKRKPLYINLVRDPLDRLVSFYYFTRNGDDIRPPRERRKDRTKEVCTILSFQVFLTCLKNLGPWNDQCLFSQMFDFRELFSFCTVVMYIEFDSCMLVAVTVTLL